MTEAGKLIIFSAPSGSGKTTIVRYLLAQIPSLAFSISATSRPPRGAEKHGVDYYFLTPEEFEKHVQNHDFLEWEEVYAGTRYGTLRSDVERLWATGKHVIFDIDVVGGLHLKSLFPERALAVYVHVPDLVELEKRLRARGTDSEEKIAMRMKKAHEELVRAPEFDLVIVNENLEKAKDEALQKVQAFVD